LFERIQRAASLSLALTSRNEALQRSSSMPASAL
jgi:hypothetical protein